jgi:hypothetical protein
MPLFQANNHIHDHLTQVDGIGNKPMIAYALNPDFLSDEIYTLIRSRQVQGNLPVGRDWIVGLYWIRRFYEEGAGNNYAQLLGNNNKVITRIFLNWRIGRAPNLADFIVQCPLVLTELAGDDSGLTRGIRFLLSELRPGFGDDELAAAVERLQQFPNHSEGQIAAANHYPKDFKAVLNTLLTGQGDGWLARFVNHPLRREILEPQWGLYLNGNDRDVAVCVYSNTVKVRISQDDRNLELQPNEGRVIATVNKLRKAGINPQKSFLISGQNFHALDTSTVNFARFRQNSPFCPFLKLDPNLQIQAARMWAFVPDGHWDFLLGDTIPPIPEKYAIRELGNLHKIDFRDIDRAQPKMLKLNGTELIQIGAAPALEVIGADAWVRSMDEPETRFVFGDRVELSLTDLSTDPQKWSCTPGAEICWENQRPILQCNGEYGKKIAVSVNVGRLYPIRLVIRFIYSDMREAMIQELDWQRNGVTWKPLPTNDPGFPEAIVQRHLVRGELKQGNETVRVWVPSQKAHFWFSLGFDVCPTDDPLHLHALDALRQRKLHAYLPPGNHRIRWAGRDWLECEGPDYWNEPLDDLNGEWSERDDDCLEIALQNGERFEVARVLDRPCGMDFEVHIPRKTEAFEKFLNAEFSLEKLAARLNSFIIDGEPWPASGDWSGKGLSEKIKTMHCSSVLGPNNQPRVRNPMPCRSTIQNLNSAVAGLHDIFRCQRPDQVWMPLDAFRVQPATEKYGFHGLKEPFANKMGLNDNQNSRILMQRSSTGRAEFFLPNSQQALPWDVKVVKKDGSPQPWLRAQAARNVSMEWSDPPYQLVAGYFDAALRWSTSLLGEPANKHLAFAFAETSAAFAGKPDRALVFQAAVLCRLCARTSIYRESLSSDDPITWLKNSRTIGDLIRTLCWKIGSSDSSREIFCSDLVTVDWALAWFHEPPNPPHLL